MKPLQGGYKKVSPDLCRCVFQKINPCRSEIKYKAELKIKNYLISMLATSPRILIPFSSCSSVGVEKFILKAFVFSFSSVRNAFPGTTHTLLRTAVLQNSGMSTFSGSLHQMKSPPSILSYVILGARYLSRRSMAN